MSPGAASPLDLGRRLNAEFFEKLGQGDLCVRKCRECGDLALPPQPRCSACGSGEGEWLQVSGRGTVWTVGVFHKAYAAEYRSRVPYNVAIVQLDEGARLLTNIVGVDEEQVRIGLSVEAVIVHQPDSSSLVQFRPSQRRDGEPTV